MHVRAYTWCPTYCYIVPMIVAVWSNLKLNLQAQQMGKCTLNFFSPKDIAIYSTMAFLSIYGKLHTKAQYELRACTICITTIPDIRVITLPLAYRCLICTRHKKVTFDKFESVTLSLCEGACNILKSSSSKDSFYVQILIVGGQGTIHTIMHLHS